jgi:hypothetical protein
LLPFLEKPGFIHDQNTIGISEVIDDVLLELITDLIGVPSRTPQQVLHAIGRGITRLLSQLPAVFAIQNAEQSL